MIVGCEDEIVPEHVKAYAVTTVKRGNEHMIAEKIRKMKEVTEALVTYGLWDIIARIEAKNIGHLDKNVTDIRQNAEIEQTSHTYQRLKIST